jgi:hypothetical protein
MPVRITFNDPKMRVHVCPDHLKDYVIEDIRARYGTEVAKVTEVESIHMDPGGMAFMNPELIQFEIQGTKFHCNAEHLPGVQYGLTESYRIVDTEEHGQIARVYMYWDLLVLPATYLWAIKTRLSFNAEIGEQEAARVADVLSEANRRASMPDPADLPENVISLYEDDKNIH